MLEVGVLLELVVCTGIKVEDGVLAEDEVASGVADGVALAGVDDGVLEELEDGVVGVAGVEDGVDVGELDGVLVELGVDSVVGVLWVDDSDAEVPPTRSLSWRAARAWTSILFKSSHVD